MVEAVILPVVEAADILRVPNGFVANSDDVTFDLNALWWHGITQELGALMTHDESHLFRCDS
jgi:hypothetical protein